MTCSKSFLGLMWRDPSPMTMRKLMFWSLLALSLIWFNWTGAYCFLFGHAKWMEWAKGVQNLVICTCSCVKRVWCAFLLSSQPLPPFLLLIHLFLGVTEMLFFFLEDRNAFCGFNKLAILGTICSLSLLTLCCILCSAQCAYLCVLFPNYEAYMTQFHQQMSDSMLWIILIIKWIFLESPVDFLLGQPLVGVCLSFF